RLHQPPASVSELPVATASGATKTIGLCCLFPVGRPVAASLPPTVASSSAAVSSSVFLGPRSSVITIHLPWRAERADHTGLGRSGLLLSRPQERSPTALVTRAGHRFNPWPGSASGRRGAKQGDDFAPSHIPVQGPILRHCGQGRPRAATQPKLIP